MSERSRKWTERSSRYRRLRSKNKAVSPVVATLILILIAVAAAAALYLWLVTFQNSTTKNIGNPGDQCTITIGGSTTVYPLTQIAIQQFEQNNSGTTICAQQGGSTAGVLSLCQGGSGIQVAESSSYNSPATLASRGCPPNTVQTTVGLDSVLAVTAKTNPVLGFLSTESSWATAGVGYSGSSLSVNPQGGAVGTVVTLTGANYAHSVPITLTFGGNEATPTVGTCFSPITTSSTGTFSCTYTSGAAGAAPDTTTVTTVQVPTAGVPFDSTFAVGAATVAGGAATTVPTVTASGILSWTQNEGGTPTALSQQAFSFNESTLDGIYFSASTTTPNFGASSTTPAFTTTWPTWLGSSANTGTYPGLGVGMTWSQVQFPSGCIPGGTQLTATSGIACVSDGAATSPIKVYDRSDNSGTQDGFDTKLLGITCGADHQLTTCDITVNGASGNPGVLAAVAGNANSIGPLSYGFATSPGSGVVGAAYQGSPAVLDGSALGAQTEAVLPTVANTQLGYTGSDSTPANSVYAGWRVLEYVTIGQPTGVAAAFINFVLTTNVNLELNAATGYVSLYAS